MICACGRAMECVNTRPYEGSPQIVRVRIYRCPSCGSREGTTEVRHKLAVVRRALNRQDKRRRQQLATKRGGACRS